MAKQKNSYDPNVERRKNKKTNQGASARTTKFTNKVRKKKKPYRGQG